MYQTDKPFGFINKDLLWIKQNVKRDTILLTKKSDYDVIACKKKSIFIIQGISLYTTLCSCYKNKLKGRFLLLDTESCLQKVKAIILDRDDIQVDIDAFIKNSLPYVSIKTKHFRTDLEKESRNFLNTISNRVLNQNKVFKKTYQNINLELLELGKKKLSPQKFSRYKKYLPELLCKVCVNYLPYSSIQEIKLGNDILKNKDGFNDVVKFCSTPSSIRTIRAFHDIVINHTDLEKAVIDNYADIYTLKLMLDSWNPNTKVEFKENYSKKLYGKLGCIDKNSLLSKEIVKRRNKRDVFKSTGKFKFQLHKGIIKLENLISKLKLPEDEYRVLGNEVKEGKVTIDSKSFALHGIHSNYVFSIGCL